MNKGISVPFDEIWQRCHPLGAQNSREVLFDRELGAKNEKHLLQKGDKRDTGEEVVNGQSSGGNFHAERLS